MSEVMEKAVIAKKAAGLMARLSLSQRNDALAAMADALIAEQDLILAENAKDMEAAEAAGTEAALLDRLALSADRLAGIALSLRDVIALPDPLGKVLNGGTLYNGILMRQVSVPIGVVAMIYEARPNVTVDAAGLCLKTGNAVILRGGSMANHSNIVLTKVLADAGLKAGLPEGWLQSIETTDRAATTELMGLHGMIDLLIPRGSGSLIKSVVENAKVPVIETGEGNCHLYIHAAADPDIIMPITLNAKLQRPGVCNSIETLLIDSAVAELYLPQIIKALTGAGVVIHADEQCLGLVEGLPELLSDAERELIVKAVEADWYTEYLALEIAIKCVSGIDEAIEHINTYSTHHSDSILSQDYEAVQRFLLEVDSAVVYANASTRFTDGGEFGLGAEIGISTQKLHARGPMGLEALTTGKYILEGSGQIR
ncbi:MAG: glutamate-5-semialdehyde dehydrogenase [Coriobacteriia bacterium]|nr:glutamate-5-semialdehyde dehydrogenase [Coriobacteriia bacterium]